MQDIVYFFSSWPPVTRILVVGTFAYAALVVLLRLSGSRSLAQMNAFDFIITIAIGSAFGRILTAKSVALVEAVTAFALLILLQYIVSQLKIRFKWFDEIITSPPRLLFYRGRFVRDGMRRSRVSEEALRTTARQHGLGSLQEVEAVVLETNGRFSLIKAEQAGDASALEIVPAASDGDNAAARPDA